MSTHAASPCSPGYSSIVPQKALQRKIIHLIIKVVLAALTLSVFVLSCMAANHQFSGQSLPGFVKTIVILQSVTVGLTLSLSIAVLQDKSAKNILVAMLPTLICSVVIFTCSALALRGALNARQLGLASIGAFLGASAIGTIVKCLHNPGSTSAPQGASNLSFGF